MPCNCCNKEIIDTKYKDQFNFESLQICTNCKHIQIKNIPENKIIKNFYENSYSKNRESFISPEYFKIMRKRAKAQIEFINKHIDLKNKKILDLGCGYGYLLKELKAYSNDILGLEFDPKAVEHCNKALKVNATQIFSEADYSNIEKVDLIVMSHVLEHIADLNNTIETLKQKTKYLFIEIPVYTSAISDQFKDQEGHLNFFNINSIKFFFESKNFKILDINQFGPSMHLFHDKKLSFLNVFFHKFKKDYFFDDYSKKNRNGIWIRALVKG